MRVREVDVCGHSPTLRSRLTPTCCTSRSDVSPTCLALQDDQASHRIEIGLEGMAKSQTPLCQGQPVLKWAIREKLRAPSPAASAAAVSAG